ncbi:MAG: hypothetical protein JWN50_144, partial [Parcubacteria group bacterium]|nr:hypothetical protein [Parcubacteria group bacterium]
VQNVPMSCEGSMTGRQKFWCWFVAIIVLFILFCTPRLKAQTRLTAWSQTESGRKSQISPWLHKEDGTAILDMRYGVSTPSALTVLAGRAFDFDSLRIVPLGGLSLFDQSGPSVGENIQFVSRWIGVYHFSQYTQTRRSTAPFYHSTEVYIRNDDFMFGGSLVSERRQGEARQNPTFGPSLMYTGELDLSGIRLGRIETYVKFRYGKSLIHGGNTRSDFVFGVF